MLILAPIIYAIVSCIVDNISEKAEETNYKKLLREEELLYFTTYNSNISSNDIMLLFISEVKKYRQSNFMMDHKIFTGKEEQNYAWTVKTKKQTFGCGFFYFIEFYFSNGWVQIIFSNTQFDSGGKYSTPYYIAYRDFGTVCIDGMLENCREEAKIMWKVNGIDSTEHLPFDYIPLSESINASSSSHQTRNQKSEKSSNEYANQPDLIAFYRNLLGLKLCFSHYELKKSYREAVVKYHPDRYGASSSRDRENAEMLMKQVNEAYETLKKIAV